MSELKFEAFEKMGLKTRRNKMEELIVASLVISTLCTAEGA